MKVGQRKRSSEIERSPETGFVLSRESGYYIGTYADADGELSDRLDPFPSLANLWV